MLTICPTPIGNLDDVTPRQREALASADIIACEDSRRTGKLLEHLGIVREGGQPRLVSYHEHNEAEAAERLGPALRGGRRVVLVSDAGTPGISDPGYRLVRQAIDEGVEIESLPGPCAAIVALAASGLPTSSFQFVGFAPSSRERRQRLLEAKEAVDGTTILYESPKRLVELLRDVSTVLGEARPVCVGRELTKMHEEYLRGSVADVLETLRDREKVRGECVVLIGPGQAEASEDVDAEIDAKILDLLDRGFRPRSIKEIVVELFDVSRSSLYDRISRLEDES